ncbi:MAG: copper amine oxidase N-terminal domain-containing protein [Defluviitaleaceae bacterium]|nr:copper amine oxidase N-terminal domain-containing protein [Defluviitaleaceae bacterium]
MKKLCSIKGFAFMVAVLLFSTVSVVYGDTPVRIGGEAAGQESITVSNVVTVEQRQARIEGMTANVTIVRANALATVTLTRDITVDHWEGRYFGNGFPIIQMDLPAGATLEDYFDYFETNPSGMRIERTQLPLTTGQITPIPNEEFYHRVSGGSTVVLSDGVYRVSSEGSFGAPLVYIVVGDGIATTATADATTPQQPFIPMEALEALFGEGFSFNESNNTIEVVLHRGSEQRRGFGATIGNTNVIIAIGIENQTNDIATLLGDTPGSIYPFSLDGTVYVPLALVEEAISIDVVVQGNTTTVSFNGNSVQLSGSNRIINGESRFVLTIDSVTPAAITPTPGTTPASSPATRTLRFTIGSTTFTDNNQSRTLEAAPFIQNDRTMVPLRVIGEALGATDLEFNSGVITFNIGSQSFTMTVDQPLPGNMGTPVIIAGRTFVPLAFIINEMGATARWDGNARAAYIYID